MKTVLSHETFHAKPGTCGHSTLLQGYPHPKGKAKTWWGGDESNTEFPTPEGSRRNGLLLATVGAQDWETLGLGTGREPKAPDLESALASWPWASSRLGFLSLLFPLCHQHYGLPAAVFRALYSS